MQNYFQFYLAIGLFFFQSLLTLVRDRQSYVQLEPLRMASRAVFIYWLAIYLSCCRNLNVKTIERAAWGQKFVPSPTRPTAFIPHSSQRFLPSPPVPQRSILIRPCK